MAEIARQDGKTVGGENHYHCHYTPKKGSKFHLVAKNYCDYTGTLVLVCKYMSPKH